ncbi:MAG: membrane protein insertase YidC [Rhodobiaceae bacterium]|nr:membrane protein insertase YidC [Rhodobiaceae bacterium]
MDDNRNTILAIALSLVILIAWQFFIGAPKVQDERDKQVASQEMQAAPTAPGSSAPAAGSAPAPDQGGAPAPSGAAPQAAGTQPSAPGSATSREAALKASPRIAIDTPSLGGSIALTGARIDDIVLKKYREDVDPKSKPIVLFSPAGSEHPYYAEFGWSSGAKTVKLPDANSVWTPDQAGALTPGKPVTLSWDNGEGLIFKRSYAVDQNAMFSITQTVENHGAEAVRLHPYGLILRQHTPKTLGYYVLHEGLIGVFGDQGLQEVKYSSILDDRKKEFSVTGGWLGFTDKYWAATLIPSQSEPFNARLSAFPLGESDATYQTDYLAAPQDIAPGQSVSVSSNLFAGAKVVNVVDGYEDALGILNFELLIDWGWFYFITKPLFYAIDFFFRLVGNFGIAILIVTVMVKIVFFPLANKSYVSMSRMKKVQPEMLKIRERFKDDKARQQQAMMELYKKEKINPMSGCLPVLLQIPVFFALYKVLFVTIEMRHAPFFGWIQDLAAPDPTTLFNLFGLIPFTPPDFLMLGVWPLIMGLTMFLQMRLNPPPPDPTQAMIFNWMPLIFTFLLARFPAGLVIYWAWNNSLSILQQYVIMRRQGVDVDLIGNIRAMFPGRKQPKAGE